MNGIILAAGKGTRLNGTGVKPKCLYEVGGVTLIRRQIEALKSAGVDKIVVVIGFEGSAIRRECGDEVIFVENLLFAQTSSLYSLWLAREHLAGGFIVLNSDVLFHRQLLINLVSYPHENALLLSHSNESETPLGEEEMKVKLKGERVVQISKELDPGEADGENVGIVKFGPRGSELLLLYMRHLIAVGATKDWAPRAFQEFANHHPLYALTTKGYPWIEIDFPSDYQRALNEVFPQIQSLAG